MFKPKRQRPTAEGILRALEGGFSLSQYAVLQKMKKSELEAIVQAAGLTMPAQKPHGHAFRKSILGACGKKPKG